MAKNKGQTHDAFVEYDEVKGPSNKNFGYTVGIIFCLIATIKSVFFNFSILAMIFYGLGGGLIAGALLFPNALTPLNKAWMGLAKILFHIVNPIIMFLLFLVAFIPAGIIMKILRYDPMKRKFDKSANTYWVEKEKTDIENPMKYQF
ncbi:MAG: hypothetical protein AAF569_06330 [Pseudomonadota bacterium]